MSNNLSRTWVPCVVFCFGLCFGPIVPAAAQGPMQCASDSQGNVIAIKTDTDLAAGAIAGLHGRLSNGPVTIPLSGTAVVDSAGAVAKIVLQGINNTDAHQHLGIAVQTDLMLNGSGTFENINPGRPFTYDIITTMWTALDPCPDAPPFARVARAGNAAASALGRKQPLGRQGEMP